MYDAKTSQPFAFTTDGKNWYLHNDSAWWAYQDGDNVFSAESSEWILYQRDRHLYDAKSSEWRYFLS
jgi:hypothetical protein